MGKEAVSYILFSGSKMNRFDHMCTNWAGVDDDGDDYRANTCEVMYMVVVERRGCRCLEPLYMEMRILQGRGGETDCQAGNGMRKSNFDDGKQCAKVIIADVSIKTCIGPSFFSASFLLEFSQGPWYWSIWRGDTGGKAKLGHLSS